MLKTGPQTYPLWNAFIRLPQEKRIEYKYAVRNAGGIHWEDLPGNENRALTLQNCNSLGILDTAGTLQNKILYVMGDEKAQPLLPGFSGEAENEERPGILSPRESRESFMKYKGRRVRARSAAFRRRSF